MKEQTRSKRFYFRSLSLVLGTVLGTVSINEIALARFGGGGGFHGGGHSFSRGSFGSRSRNLKLTRPRQKKPYRCTAWREKLAQLEAGLHQVFKHFSRRETFEHCDELGHTISWH